MIEIRMVSVLWNVIKKIFGILLTILSPLKRLLCRRKRRTSDTILPLSNHYSIPGDFSQMATNGEEEFQAWDEWETESKKAATNGQLGNPRPKNSQTEEEEEEIDFFLDMTPKIRRQKKVYVGGNSNTSQLGANKFAFLGDAPLNQGAELGSWEDTENAWGEESLEDLSWQAEAAIKQSRKSEQQRRLQEHARRKMEKEQARSKKDSMFTAVKLTS
ncbi:receptor-binding cancer antigen expressed on SiSo cells-like isoform X2 [Ostrea edulis]|uniref:receptor-binding cancer antigen expressed on SiSo cells-like isoform X2 n=1 Tax=Ostrea edulis TaxID=37623 RepID=UPI0024AF1BBE|nr:receptor-binding cancer antigen expressed on SiSo cells-like isoform X2 [Ostrea edulis]